MKTKLMALDALRLATPQNGMFDEERAKCLAAISTLEADIAEPVTPHGWMVSGVPRVYFGEHSEMDATQEARQCGGTAKAYKIYATPQEPAVAAIPAGWKLVPIVPTRGMCAAAVKYANGDAVYKNVAAAALEIEESIYGEAYSAMLAAAPGGAA